MTDARFAVISGAAGGIGRALAEGFLAAGYEVIGVDRELEGWSAPRFRYVTLDITGNDAVAEFGAGLERLDVLINAAGIIRRVAEFEIETFETVLDVNLTGTMRLSTACRPALARHGGAIVNVGSMLSFFGGGLVPAYSASKGGIVTLTKSLAIAWAKDNIRVNAIAPGWIATPLTEALQKDAARNRGILERTPMGRWGTPQDLVGPALFLASDAARFITGAVLAVDGGYSSM
ncbi:MAG TPA: SDR family oxidoreductase [Bauldia sp.]|nr:SDR family oxidoreductase [Bauldia sp.]